jgi:predicted nucleic acid-binding protein
VAAEVAGWDLGSGETQVLALALSRGGPEVVLDDRQARRCARSLGLATTGTLAHDLVEASLAEAGE